MKTKEDCLNESFDKYKNDLDLMVRIAEKAMDIHAKEVAIDILNWVTNEKSPYAILYGNQLERFATKDEDFTSEQLFEKYIQSKNQ